MLVAVAVAVLALILVAMRFALEVRARDHRVAAASTPAQKRRLNPWYRTPEEQEEYRNL